MFFTIEGCDGSGKTSVLNILRTYIDWNPYKVVFTREPGGMPYSEDVRNFINYIGDDIEPESAALLFLSARYEHYYKKILPNLLQGNVVFCDRFIDSTYAYQCARGGNQKLLEDLHELLFPNLKIQRTYFLDVAPSICFKRAMKRNPHEGYDLQLQEKIYAQYQANFKDKDNVLMINGEDYTAKEIAYIIANDVFENFLK